MFILCLIYVPLGTDRFLIFTRNWFQKWVNILNIYICLRHRHTDWRIHGHKRQNSVLCNFIFLANLNLHNQSYARLYWQITNSYKICSVLCNFIFLANLSLHNQSHARLYWQITNSYKIRANFVLGSTLSYDNTYGGIAEALITCT